jgi:hypothetical protein
MSNSIYNSSGLGVDSLMQPGVTIVSKMYVTDPSAVDFSNYYSGFPTGISTNYNWENPSTLGYQISGVDIANSVKAVYTNYSGANGTSYTFTPPSWCNTLKIIAIAGGGGGGSGGANTNNNRAGSGGSGAGGAHAILVSTLKSNQSNFSYNIDFVLGDNGAGGAYQGTPSDPGHWGHQGTSISINVSSGNNSGTFWVYGGGGGGPGPGTSNSNNDSVGGQNTSITSGNNATTPILNSLGNYNVDLSCSEYHAGNSGGGGGNSYIGAAGTIVNFNDVPPLNTNYDYRSVQNNNTEINNTNHVPGYGQGGVGGWNSNNNNGYYGQNGGPALVRVYYMV